MADDRWQMMDDGWWSMDDECGARVGRSTRGER